ncbi:MAG: site-specific integrase [Desulfovibrionaceae bacterium]|nr:site-specific integrase [Desulfovibrionaceae bacterium]
MGRQKTDYPGVYYHLKKNGDRIYYIRYRRGGRDTPQIEEPVGTSARGMTAAKANHIRAAKINLKTPTNKEVRRAREQEAEEGRRPKWTLEKLFEDYQAGLPPGEGRKVDTRNFQRLGTLRTKEPAGIEIAELRDLKKTLEEKKLAPQTIKHILGTLSRTLNWAAAPEQQMIPAAEAARLKFQMPKIDNARKTEALTDDQLRKYLAALDEEKDQDAAALLRLALFTGMRRGALLGLKWSDIDFERAFITLRGKEAKNKETTMIPLNEVARAVLEAVERTSEYCFPGRKGEKRTDFRRMARRVRDKAGLPSDFRPLHGLRHSFASRIASSGEVDMYRLQMLMTHKEPKMTQRYAHLADEAMRKAAEVAAKVMSTPENKK